MRRGHNIHTVVSFNAETDFSGKKNYCQETQTESNPDYNDIIITYEGLLQNTLALDVDTVQEACIQQTRV